MRQGHQNRRGRGRNNNNNNNNNQGRRNQNSLTRSFESTGPDIKIRGTPAHIAEKYLTLARDAALSGDPVLAENYLQHAEHYNRIIMAVREQQMGPGGDPNAAAMTRPSSGGLSDRFGEPEDFGDDEGDETQPEGTGAPGFEGQPQSQPQQNQGFQPRGDGGQRFDNRRDRQNDFRNGGERHDRGDRDRGDRGQDRGYDRNFDRNGGQRQFRDDRHRDDRPRDDRPRDDRPREDRGSDRDQGDAGFNQRRREGFRQPSQPQPGPNPAAAGGTHEQPEFLRRPVRRPRRDDEQASPAPTPAPADESQD